MMGSLIVKVVQVHVHILREGDTPEYGLSGTEGLGSSSQTYGESGWEPMLRKGGDGPGRPFAKLVSREHAFESEQEVEALLRRAMDETDAHGFVVHISFGRGAVGIWTSDGIAGGLEADESVMEGTTEAVASGLLRWATVRDVMTS